MPEFRIYYADGSTFAGKAWDAPAFGVLVIVERDSEHGRRLVTTGDYYVWRDERWWACDFVGLIDYLAQPGPRKVLIGRMVSNDAFRSAYMAADSDTDFPQRTGYGVYEKRLTI